MEENHLGRRLVEQSTTQSGLIFSLPTIRNQKVENRQISKLSDNNELTYKAKHSSGYTGAT